MQSNFVTALLNSPQTINFLELTNLSREMRRSRNSQLDKIYEAKRREV